MKKLSGKRNRHVQVAKPGASKKILLPALVAASSGFSALPVAALELGEVTVHSTLGQPLAASIAVALAPNEELSNTCVSLQRGTSAGGLPAVDSATISIANGVISLSGKTAIREPMLSMRVNIKCRYTPNLSREYTLFVDPPGLVATPTEGSTVVLNGVSVSSQPAKITTSQPTTRPYNQTSNQTPVEKGTKYQVQPGDTLSAIAQDIENRPVGLWVAVMAIFDANPDAFMDSDPNKLKAGSWLNIPDFGGVGSSVVANNDASVNQSAASSSGATIVVDAGVESAGTAYPGIDESQTTATDYSTAVVVEPETVEADAPLADLQPGDVILDSDNPVILDSDNPYVTPTESNAVETIILNTPLESPAVANTPNGTTISIQTPRSETSSSNLLVWLAGSGIAIIVALLLFGRRFRNLFGSAPIGTITERPERRRSESGTEILEGLKELDHGILDDSPTDENLILDADLIAGTGLEQGTDMHFAQDFGLAASSRLDMELPEDLSSGSEAPSSETDIIPALQMDVESILESEVLPGDDDYDMSVIVDATQMPQPEDVTERDLKVVAVDMNDETLISDDYTLNKDVDFDVLEQDYEDEMTATQLLNQEIAKAAAELAKRMEAPDGDTDVTDEVPQATVTDLDVTAQLPADNGEIGDADETSITPGHTAEFAVDDQTVKMPANDSDVTPELPVDSDKVDTKAR